MSKKNITGYVVAGLFTIVEIVIIGVGYEVWDWPPAILIPTLGILTFFGVLIIVNLFSRSSDLRKGEIRNAIAASLLAVYFFLISVTLFASSSPLERFGQAGIPAAQSTSAETQATDENASAEEEQPAANPTTANDILDGLLDDFTKLIMVVVGFYFGGRSAEEIVNTLKGGPSSQTTPAPAPQPNPNPAEGQPQPKPQDQPTGNPIAKG